MRIWGSRIPISVDPVVFPVATLCLLLVPLPWVMAWISAVLLHENLHMLAILLCGERICGIRIGTGGASIITSGLSCPKEAICAISGPFAGLLLLPLIPLCPRIAFCGIFHSAYNLLPILPLDGGRALYCFLYDRIGRDPAERIMKILQNGTLLALLLFSLYLTILRHLGYMPLIFFAMLFYRCRKNTLQRKRRKVTIGASD